MNKIEKHIKGLKSDDFSTRWCAARVLGKFGDKTATPALIEALKDDDPDVRMVVAWALRKLGVDV